MRDPGEEREAFWAPNMTALPLPCLEGQATDPTVCSKHPHHRMEICGVPVKGKLERGVQGVPSP